MVGVEVVELIYENQTLVADVVVIVLLDSTSPKPYTSMLYLYVFRLLTMSHERK